MRSYTQDELSSIWQQLKDGTEPDEALVFSAHITADRETEQAMMLSTQPTAYNDFDNDDSKARDYIRTRGNKEAVWGIWESYSPRMTP
ncbi:MAG: hypothetical protein ACLQMO_10515 [Acidobacteriaceae bacterium]